MTYAKIENNGDKTLIGKLLREKFFSPMSMSSLLNSERGKSKIFDTLQYNFLEFTTSELGKVALRSLYEQLLALHKSNPKTTDLEYYHVIAEWYRISTPEQKQYPMSAEDFYQQKTNTIADIIRSTQTPQNSSPDKKELLDIGCGDCEMCFRVANALKINKTGIDLQGADDWGLETGGGKIGELAATNSIVYYDGLNLADALLPRYPAGTKTPFDVIMFNHVLHHYPNFKAQIDGLKQAVLLLKPNGVLFLSEHQNILSDKELHMQHVLFDLKTTVVSAARRYPDDLNQQKKVIHDEIVNYSRRKGDVDLYFSTPLLVNILESIGLKVTRQQSKASNGVPDASHTMFFAAIKPQDWSPEMFRNLSSLDDNHVISKREVAITPRRSYDDFDLPSKRQQHASSINSLDFEDTNYDGYTTEESNLSAKSDLSGIRKNTDYYRERVKDLSNRLDEGSEDSLINTKK